MVELLQIRRGADERPPGRSLKKARFDEALKQHPTHLPVEACHQSDVSGGELYAACLREQLLNTCKRLFEAPRLAWLRHGALLSQLLLMWPSVNETDRGCRTFR